MLSLRLSFLALAAFTASAAAKAADFVGSGYVAVLHSDDVGSASPSDRIGCLDSDGHFTKSDCAIFTTLSEYPFALSTDKGDCTFSDKEYERNKDSFFTTPAFHCFSENEAVIEDAVYTISGFRYPFLCTGYYDCFFDAKHVPFKDEKIPIWQMFRNSQQMDITPGHVQLMWLWVPVET